MVLQQEEEGLQGVDLEVQRVAGIVEAGLEEVGEEEGVIELGQQCLRHLDQHFPFDCDR